MTFKSLLNEIAEGRRMTSSEFLQLYNEADLLSLGKAANKVRNRLFADKVITFIIDRNINYTNICVCGCRFCAFFRPPGHTEGYVLSLEDIMDKVDAAVELGATQLMIQGGLNPAVTLDFFLELFYTVKQRYPTITIHSLTAPEIDFLAGQTGVSVSEILVALRHSGLDSLPGGGAEILAERVRNIISPHKISVRTWLDIMQTAHGMGMETTATMMMGSVDVVEDRIEHLSQIRDLQDITGGFRAFIAWTYQEQQPKLKQQPVSAVEYLKFMALSRLYLDNFKHIQASWLTQGKRLGQLSLFFGADDMGSIMLEENVVKAAGTQNKMSLSEMIALINQAGFIPAQRDSRYNRIKYFSDN